MAAYRRVHDYACCHLQADCRVQDQLRYPTLELRLWNYTFAL